MKNFFKNLVSKLKTPQKQKKGENISIEQLFFLPKTPKVLDQHFLVFFVLPNNFEKIDDLPDDADPLYIAATGEEALAACLRLLYVKHFGHYTLWCKGRNLEVGFYKPSWSIYIEDVLQDINAAIMRNFKVITGSVSFGDFMSSFRMQTGAMTVLGLPSESLTETNGIFKKGGNKDVTSTLKNYLNCNSVGEFMRRVAMMSPEKYYGTPQEKGLKEIWEEIAKELEESERSESTSKETEGRKTKGEYPEGEGSLRGEKEEYEKASRGV